MTYIARPTDFRLLKDAREALFRPAPESERFDPEFPVAIRCSQCGKMGYGPRKHIEEAIEEHRQKCPARVRAENTEKVLENRIFYPRS